MSNHFKSSNKFLFAVYLYSTSWVLVVVGGIFFKKERKKKKTKGNKRENNQTEKSFFCFISLIAVAPKSSSLHRKIPPGCLHAPPLLTDQITYLLYLFFSSISIFLYQFLPCLLIKSWWWWRWGWWWTPFWCFFPASWSNQFFFYTMMIMVKGEEDLWLWASPAYWSNHFIFYVMMIMIISTIMVKGRDL